MNDSGDDSDNDSNAANTDDGSSSELPDVKLAREQEEAGKNLAEVLINLHLDQIPISAYWLCVIAHWASKSGAIGMVHDMAKAPGDRITSSYSKKLKRVLNFGFVDCKLQEIDVVGYSRAECGRRARKVFCHARSRSPP